MGSRFSGMGSHHSPKVGTVEWLTPPEVIAALGPFDLDPCAPEERWPTAERKFTQRDNGLIQPWRGRIWLNPPYTNGVIEKWLARMAEHDLGTALIFARTETDAFFRYVFERATALLFMRGRINFHHGPGHVDTNGAPIAFGKRAKGDAGAPTVLCAYGMRDADILAACKIDGQFVPLRFPRSVLVSLFASSPEGEKIDTTWRQALAEFFADQDGPVELDDLYRAFRGHPKAAGNRNVEAKIRQELQRGPYERVDRGVWQPEGA